MKGNIKRADVVAYVRQKGSATSEDVAAELGLSVKNANAHLARATAEGSLSCCTRSIPYVYTAASSVGRGMPMTEALLRARIAQIDGEIAELRREREMLVRAVGS